MTPTLPDVDEPAAAGACAQADATPKMLAAARATVRTTNPEFTLFSLFLVRHEETGTNPRQVSLA